MCSVESESMSRKRQYEAVDRSMKKLREIFVRLNRTFTRKKRAELSARGLS